MKLVSTLIAIVLTGWVSTLDARVRVATGQDLYDVCKLAVDQQLAEPGARLSGRARYCRQYLEGYFGSLKALLDDEQARKVHTHDEADRVQCARVPEAATFAQLEQRVVTFAQWHPELMDGPAVDLVMKAFDSLNPC